MNHHNTTSQINSNYHQNESDLLLMCLVASNSIGVLSVPFSLSANAMGLINYKESKVGYRLKSEKLCVLFVTLRE